MPNILGEMKHGFIGGIYVANITVVHVMKLT